MSDHYLTELHEALLRVAGWLPDDVLAHARRLLADERSGDVARLLVFAGSRIVLPLNDDDLGVLTELLEREDIDPEVLETIELAAELPPVLWAFSEEPPDTGDGCSESEADGPALTTRLAENDLVSAVVEEGGVRALWRAWRAPFDAAPYPLPRPVYVIEVDGGVYRLREHGTGAVDGAKGDEDGEVAEATEADVVAVDVAKVAGRLQAKLVAAGERDPQIEVLSPHAPPPPYQRAARVGGKLIWAAEPEISIARVFDVVDRRPAPH